MSRRPAALLTAALLTSGLLPAVLPSAAAAQAPPDRVTLMGSLMQELGCEADWDEGCTATDLRRGPGGTWTLTGTLPAGAYEYKVRYDGSWAENYGEGGAADGPNVPLVLAARTAVRFTHDEASGRTTAVPAVAQPGLTAQDRTRARSSLREDLTRERFYFVMADRFENGDRSNDTGGIGGGRLQSGLDPTHKGFFHGGDLRGLIDRLDYVEGLGTTAIWLTPSFQNKPVQGSPGQESAGYHGYWVTDFTRIDPHLGTNAELEELVDRAHARGIKVFFDIITNHTADVLTYEDSAYAADGAVPYRSKAEFPYRDADGVPFDDRDPAHADEFPEVSVETTFPYRPVVPPGEEDAKVPAWLNDPTMYHSRGTSTFAGEDSEYGDFPSGDRSALDDLWTERPEVVRGMIDIYSTWVRDAGVDGFRIDTVKHVGLDFWKRFGPALQRAAAAAGDDDFFMFGEVYDADPRVMSRYTTAGKLQATVDFGFQGSAVGFAKGRPTTELRELFAADDLFTDRDSNAYSLPTFLGNHDMGRIGTFLSQGGGAEADVLARDRLAHELMFLTRGQPVVYYGDEQGFVGDGGDQDAREDMFPSRVASYNDNDLLGTTATTARSNFDTAHPLYRHIRALADLRERYPALADGAQEHRFASDRPGVYAFSRTDVREGVEHLVAINNATTAKRVTLQTHSARMPMKRLWPTGARGVATRTDDEGRVALTVPPLSTVVLRAVSRIGDAPAPRPSFRSPASAGDVVGGRAEIAVEVPGGGLNEVTFLARLAGTQQWTTLGTDDARPYRVFHDVSTQPAGMLMEYRAVVRASDGDLGAVGTSAGTRPQAVAPPTAPGGPVPDPSAVSVPGSHGSEMGCPEIITGAGGDWEPACPQGQLTERPDGVWQLDTALPAGTYEYKAALDRSWDLNYGAGAQQNGSNIVYTHAGGPITFWFDPRTAHVSSSAQGPALVAVGSLQSEAGCPTDDDPSCLATWLQDPDGDGVFALALRDLPAGSYTAAVGDAATTVTASGPGWTTTLRYADGRLSASEARAAGTPDLSTSRATWVRRDLVRWDVASGLRYRLHWGPRGSLAVDAETLGGTSVPLTRDAGGLHLSKADARRAGSAPRSGSFAVAAYDASGRLVDATSLRVAWR